MVHFRKRFTTEMVQRINEIMYERAHPAEENKPEDKDEPPEGDSGNKGVLILDATVAPADIKYPTDLGLVNDCRENTEKFIEKLWEFSDKAGHKTAYNRKKARRNYLRVAKQRKAKLKATWRAIGEHLTYVGKNLETLSRLKEEVGENRLSPADIPAVGDGVTDGILGGLVGHQSVPERGIAPLTKRPDSLTW